MKKLLILLAVSALARGAYVVSHVGHPNGRRVDVPIMVPFAPAGVPFPHYDQPTIPKMPDIPHFPGKQVPV